jgi:hypothetical protein
MPAPAIPPTTASARNTVGRKKAKPHCGDKPPRLRRLPCGPGDRCNALPLIAPYVAEAAANLLTNPQLDPMGKIPELKFCAAKVEPAEMAVATE